MKQCFSVVWVLPFMCLNGFSCKGQSLFTLNPDHHFMTSTIPDTLLSFEHIEAWSEFEISTDDTLYLKWQVVEPDECPDEWDFLVGDTQLHWPSSFTTNIDTSMNLYYPMELNPDVSWGKTFELDVRPFQVEGCCTVKVLFSLVEQPDSILEEVTYDISMLDSSCFISGSKEVRKNDLHLNISPNPSSGRFQLTSDFPIQSTCLFDLLGNVVHNQQQNEGNSLIVDDMANGTYFLRVEFQNGRFGWEKIIVQR